MGDVCDNCPGLSTDYPGDHTADLNDGPLTRPGPPPAPGFPPTPPKFDMTCKSDADCVKIGAVGKCAPNYISRDPSTGTLVFHKRRVCTKFPDSDRDGVGNACDNCPNTPNKGFGLDSKGGDLNGQPNCNLLAEYAGNVPYPYHGDACDPNPCNHALQQAPLDPDYQVGQDLWVGGLYAPQVLPETTVQTPPPGGPYYYPPALQSQFDPDYSGTPTATVGARVCDCGFDPNTGQLLNPLQCDKRKICQVSGGLYKDPQPAGGEWRELKTFYTTLSPSFPSPQPTAGDFAQNGEVSGLQVMAPPDTSLTSAQASHILPYGVAPNAVAWDVTASGGSEQGILGFGLLGVYWTSVRNVPQMSSGTPPPASVFIKFSNNYINGFLGDPRNLPGKVRAVCPLCDLDQCQVCLQRICKTCMSTPDPKLLVVNPETRQIIAQSSAGTLDITNEFAPNAIDAIFEPGVRWLTAAERGGWVGLNGVAYATLSADGTTVDSVLYATAEGVGALGGPAGTADPPPPRSDFGAVLSDRELAVYVIGGELQSGGLAKDLWEYDIPDTLWTQISFTGPAPEKVLAATYLPDTQSLWIVDQTTSDHGHSATVRTRLLRLDLETRESREIGWWWPRYDIDQLYLSGAPGGRLLLSGNSSSGAALGVVLEPQGEAVQVIGAFSESGTLAVQPTLTDTALALPLVSSDPTGVATTMIPIDGVLFFGGQGGDQLRHGQGHGRGHHETPGSAHHDPPSLGIGDLL